MCLCMFNRMEDVQTWSDTPVHLAIKCLSRISHDRTVRERLVANHIDAVMADVADADIEALATAQEKCQLFKAGANGEDKWLSCQRAYNMRLLRLVNFLLAHGSAVT